MGWINSMWSRKTASELCGCGDPATGQDARGNPACAQHDFAAEIARHLEKHPEDRPSGYNADPTRTISDILHDSVRNPDILEEPKGAELARHDQLDAERREEQVIRGKLPQVCTVCLQPNLGQGDLGTSNHARCNAARDLAWKKLGDLAQDIPGYINDHEEAARVMLQVPGIRPPEQQGFLRQVVTTPTDKEFETQKIQHGYKPTYLGSTWAERYASGSKLCDCHGWPALQCPNPVIRESAEAAILPPSAEGINHTGHEINRHMITNSGI